MEINSMEITWSLDDDDGDDGDGDDDGDDGDDDGPPVGGLE